MAYLGKTPSQAVRSRYYFTATGGETSLSGTDDNSNTLTFTDGNYVDVALNGVTLVAGTDYNTTTANTIGGLTALVASDVVEVIVYDTFSVFGGNMAANLNFKDNVKANFGTGNDLQIYHDGSNSFVSENGIGSLFLQGDVVAIRNSGGTEDFAQFTENGAATLYYDNASKLATTATGVNVTGTVTADGLTVDTNTLYVDSTNNRVGVGTTNTSVFNAFAADAIIGGGTTNAGITVYSGSASTGNINFADGTTGYDLFQGYINYDHSNNKMGFYVNYAGSSGPRMSIDSSGNVGIGVSSMTNKLVLPNTAYFAMQDTGGAESLAIRANSSNAMEFLTGGGVKAIIDSSGNVKIGEANTDVTSRLTVSGQGSADTATFMYDGNTGTYLDINTNAANGVVSLEANARSGNFPPLTFITGGSERLRILSTGGLTFNGDTAAANALDDYEEGTWTPTLLGTTSNPTFSSIGNTTGHYVKIGNMVHVTYYAPIIAFTSAGSGTSTIGGLPFTAANGTEEYWLFQYLHGDALNGTTTGGYINKNGNIMSFVAQGSTASVPWQSSGSRYLMISASYRAA